MEMLQALEPFVPVLFVLALVVLILAINFVKKDIDVTLPGGGSIHGSKTTPGVEAATQVVAGVVDSMQLRLDQYGEVAAALEAVLNADSARVEAAAREWFTTLATRLAHLLREQGDHHYRVAIWLDGDDPVDFIGVGYGMFDAHDDNMDRLERANTIGGLAFKSVTGDYYCRDTRTDPNFKPRKTVPPSFHSVYALALGRLNDPWAVMTVDSRQTNGFPDDRKLLVRRFGELASLGAVAWSVKAPGA